MNLEKELYTVLNTTGVKVFPGIASQNAKLPYIIYNVTSDKKTNGLNEISTVQDVRFQIDIYTDTTDERFDTNSLIENALGLSSLKYLVYNSINSNEKKTYRKTIDLKVWSNS